jgi:hypothetical protein
MHVSWIFSVSCCHSALFAGLFLKDFKLDVEKAFRNVGKLDSKNESTCKTSHVVHSGVRNVKHLDDIESPSNAIMRIQVSAVMGTVEYDLSWQPILPFLD